MVQSRTWQETQRMKIMHSVCTHMHSTWSQCGSTRVFSVVLKASALEYMLSFATEVTAGTTAAVEYDLAAIA